MCVSGGQIPREDSGQGASGAAEKRALLRNAVQTRQVMATLTARPFQENSEAHFVSLLEILPGLENFWVQRLSAAQEQTMEQKQQLLISVTH